MARRIQLEEEHIKILKRVLERYYNDSQAYIVKGFKDHPELAIMNPATLYSDYAVDMMVAANLYEHLGHGALNTEATKRKLTTISSIAQPQIVEAGTPPTEEDLRGLLGKGTPPDAA